MHYDTEYRVSGVVIWAWDFRRLGLYVSLAIAGMEKDGQKEARRCRVNYEDYLSWTKVCGTT